MDGSSAMSYGGGAIDDRGAYYRQFSPAGLPPQQQQQAPSPSVNTMDIMVKIGVLESKIAERDTTVMQLTERVAVLEHEMRRVRVVLEEKASKLEVQAALEAISKIKESASALVASAANASGVNGSQSDRIDAESSAETAREAAPRLRTEEVRKNDIRSSTYDDRSSSTRAGSTVTMDTARSTSSINRSSTYDRRDDEDRRGQRPDYSSRRSGDEPARRDASPVRTSKRGNGDDSGLRGDHTTRNSTDATTKRARTSSNDDRSDLKRRGSDDDSRRDRTMGDDRDDKTYIEAPNSASDYAAYYSYYYSNPSSWGYNGYQATGANAESKSTYDRDGITAGQRSLSSDFTPKPTHDDEQFAIKWTIGNPQRMGIHRVPRASATQLQPSDVYFLVRILDDHGRKVTPSSSARYLPISEINSLLSEEDRETLRVWSSNSVRSHCIKASFVANLWVTNTRTANDVLWLTHIGKPFRSRIDSEEYWKKRHGGQAGGSGGGGQNSPMTGRMQLSKSGIGSSGTAQEADGDKRSGGDGASQGDSNSQQPSQSQQRQQLQEQSHKQLQQQEGQQQQVSGVTSQSTTAPQAAPTAEVSIGAHNDVDSFLRSMAHLARSSPQVL